VNASTVPRAAATPGLRAASAPRVVAITSVARPAMTAATAACPAGEALSATIVSKSRKV
jgi:hypothetical protein